MTLLRALHLLLPVRILPFLLPVSAAIAQTDASALQWLQRIYSATQKLSYTGTFVYQQGQQVETSRITHLVDASGPHEKIESLDGVPREIIRNRDEVVCYLPATMTVKIDKQPGWRSFPAILPEQLKGLSENYRVKKAEVERVAGYDCQVIVLEPKDRMRYGHRLWADLNTGMLLKAKTLDDRNGV
ncbi:MAG: sigma-E factor regulatory protein RseB domain-containing protein, partial [Burkholderiales bacterium]